MCVFKHMKDMRQAESIKFILEVYCRLHRTSFVVFLTKTPFCVYLMHVVLHLLGYSYRSIPRIEFAE